MNSYQVTTSTAINAPAAQVYAILADYHDGHPRILPKPYFTAWEVGRGGIGAGTIIRFQMRGRLERILSTLLLRYICFQVLKLLAAFAEKGDDVRIRPVTPSAQFGLLYLSK